LLEGSVKVNDKILKPNEQSTLVNGQISIQQVDVDNVVAWKNGMFLFEDETLANIMRKIERWYDVEVVYTNGIDKNELYGGGVSRYDNVSKVLEKLTLTGGIHFKIEGRKITVMR
jgi:ferric-dicitrate binding protein FerR (iron transport regulator)